MISILIALLLTFLLVVGFHEAGHAWVARFFSVKIQRAFIGFGKPMLTWTTKSGCELGVGVWLLGGYIRLLNSRIEPVPTKQWPYCFDKKPIWIRVSILLAGSFANYVIAVLLFTAVFVLGFQETPPTIQSIAPLSPAAHAGLKPMDKLIGIEGRAVHSWQETSMAVISLLGQKNVPVIVQKPDGSLKTLSMDFSGWHYQKKGNSLLAGFGIHSDASHRVTVKGEPLMQALSHALSQSMEWLAFFLIVLKQLFRGLLPFTLLLGPVGLFMSSITSFLQGIVVFFGFIATLSLAVGLMNILPIPGLDGGSIVYALLEKVRGKPLSVATEILLYRLFMIVFYMVLVQLILNDLRRLIVA